MNQDNNWIDDFVKGQLSAIKFETNWLNGYTLVDASRAFEYGNAIHNGVYSQIDNYVEKYVDKDEKIRDLEARVKELEAILEEEI